MFSKPKNKTKSCPCEAKKADQDSLAPTITVIKKWQVGEHRFWYSNGRMSIGHKESVPMYGISIKKSELASFADVLLQAAD